MKRILKIIRKYIYIGYFTNCILMITLYLIFWLYYLKYYDYFKSNGNILDPLLVGNFYKVLIIYFLVSFLNLLNIFLMVFFQTL